jgi:hypothetical protein
MTAKRYLGDYITPSEVDDEPETPAMGYTPGVLQPGDRIHFFDNGSILVREGFYGGAEYFRGTTVTVTAEMLRLNVGRDGTSWLSLVDDVPAQIQRWGHQRLGRGPWPENEPLVVRGTPEADDERARLLDAAKGIADPVAAKAERARIIAAYGHPSASVTLGVYGGTR